MQQHAAKAPLSSKKHLSLQRRATSKRAASAAPEKREDGGDGRLRARAANLGNRPAREFVSDIATHRWWVPTEGNSAAAHRTMQQ